MHAKKKVSQGGLIGDFRKGGEGLLIRPEKEQGWVERVPGRRQCMPDLEAGASLACPGQQEGEVAGALCVRGSEVREVGRASAGRARERDLLLDPSS